MSALEALYAADAGRPRKHLFDGDYREAVGECVQRTVANMLAVATRYDHWIIAYSGGKDSSTVLTVIVTLVQLGAISAPKTLTVMYADTGMELPPLQAAARIMMQRLRDMGIDVVEVRAPLDERFYVYMLGRGVPPPSNTFRWCTPQIKVEPMTAAIRARVGELDGKVLTLTGVRRGESKARDDRINLSCSRNGAECGQGWLQTDLPGELTDTFAPIDHWTLCNVWDWLKVFAPWAEFGAWPTPMIADGYGELEDMRTGCVGCNLISHDGALAAVLKIEGWRHLSPLLGLKLLYTELRKPQHRKRQPGGQTRKDGTLQSNQQRMGPLTFEARLMGLDRVLGIQRQVNAMADDLGGPGIVLVDEEEETRICRLVWSWALRHHRVTGVQQNPFKGMGLVSKAAKGNRATTRAEYDAYRAKARELGFQSMATAAALAFEGCQRTWDVFGYEDPDGGKHRGFRWEDYTEETVSLVQSKTGNLVTLPLAMAAADGERLPLYPDLEEEIARSRAVRRESVDVIVVEERSGAPYKERRMSTIHRKICEAAGLPKQMTFTGFRHGGITEVGAVTADVRPISGHATLDVTRIYNKVTEDKAREIARARRAHVLLIAGTLEADDEST